MKRITYKPKNKLEADSIVAMAKVCGFSIGRGDHYVYPWIVVFGKSIEWNYSAYDHKVVSLAELLEFLLLPSRKFSVKLNPIKGDQREAIVNNETQVVTVDCHEFPFSDIKSIVAVME